MNDARVKISPMQITLLIAGYILGSSLLTSFMDDIAKQDAWLVIITAFIVSIPFVLSYAFLAKRFPGRSFAEISETVYGPYIGKAVVLLYAGNFFYLLSLNILDVAEFYTGYIMPEMPPVIFLIVFAIVASYALKKGIETIARLSIFSVLYTSGVVIVTILLLLGNIDLNNFLPAFEVPAGKFIQSTHIFSTISFCEVVVILTVFPAVSRTKKLGKHTMIGFSIAALGLFLISVRNTAVLGASADIVSNPSYEAGRLIDVGQVLTRIELFIALGITLALFIKVCLLYYATTTCIAQLFRMRSVSPILIPVGAIGVVMGLLMFHSVLDHEQMGKLYQPIYLMFFEFLIPPLSLLIAKLRKLPRTLAKRTPEANDG